MEDKALEDKVYTVSEITREVKTILESEFQSIWVEGEISNFVLHTSGHRYFTLKDASAQIKAVIWRFLGQGLKIELKDGLKVRVYGDITLYEKGGYYQLRVSRLLPVGVGSLEEQFQRLKEKLASEGLFAPERKRPIPTFPRAIGIVTSPTGAAIRDIVDICRRRAPAVELILRPARVQGDGAAEDIVKAIEEFNRWGGVDLLIVGRGGGSLEDLWAFNEESVARAMFESQIPVISAVGHEIDFSISDFVADLRAATPSVAAELATYDAQAILTLVSDSQLRIGRALRHLVESRGQILAGLSRSRVFTAPQALLEPRYQRLDDGFMRLRNAAEMLVLKHTNRVTLLQEKLQALSPDSVLRRGYAVVRRRDDLSIVKSAALLKEGDKVHLVFADGDKPAVVE